MISKKEIEMLVSDDVVRVEVSGTSLDNTTIATLFSLLAKENISIDLLCFAPASHHGATLIFSVFNQDCSKVLKATAQIKKTAALRIIVQGGYSKITFHGVNLLKETGIASSCFSALSSAQTETVLVSASGTDLSLLVQNEALDRTLSQLESVFGFCAYEV